jgi:hypothetical protein
MSQIRNKTGVKFEKEVCKLYGWEHKTSSPKINWNGSGRNNFQKIKNFNFDASLFNPLVESNLEKYDALDQNGQKIEIKKYNSNDLIGKWTLYSEPFFKVGTKKQLKPVVNFLGDGDIELARKRYNSFLVDMSNKDNSYILNSISNSNIGIQFIDKFFSKDNIEFKIDIGKGWNGFHRLTIFFKIN